jgi:hypothetical protein
MVGKWRRRFLVDPIDGGPDWELSVISCKGGRLNITPTNTGTKQLVD